MKAPVAFLSKRTNPCSDNLAEMFLVPRFLLHSPSGRNGACWATLIRQPNGGPRRDHMLEKLKASLLTLMLTVWSTMVMAQTSPGGTTGGGASSPSGTTTSANPGGAAGEGMNWIWIVVAVIVVAALLFYFLGRGRSTRV
jgi:hypothetical protein